MRPIKLSTTEISESSMPYIIAEIGVNHENSMETAMRLVEEAKVGGAHAAKFQTYKADLITMRDSPAYWDKSEEPADSQHELFSKYDVFGPAEYKSLAEHCRYVGIDFMSTPFDLQAVDDLNSIVDVFKVASADITNIPLLRKIGCAGKPVIMSTGASNMEEIDRGLVELESAGATNVVILHCILNYPTDDANANLRMIQHLRDRYSEYWVGISDHTRPSTDNLASIIAYTLGARVIEKHFTHNKLLQGNDHYHAMDKYDLSRLVKALEITRTLLGKSSSKFSLDSEGPARLYARRGICVVSDLLAGHVIMESDLICLRPVTGISAEHWDEVVGQTLTKSVAKGEALSWECISH
jgi:sialic acid synthase SpsE